MRFSSFSCSVEINRGCLVVVVVFLSSCTVNLNVDKISNVYAMEHGNRRWIRTFQGVNEVLFLIIACNVRNLYCFIFRNAPTHAYIHSYIHTINAWNCLIEEDGCTSVNACKVGSALVILYPYHLSVECNIHILNLNWIV